MAKRKETSRVQKQCGTIVDNVEIVDKEAKICFEVKNAR